MAVSIALVGGAHIHTPGFIKRLKERSDVAVRLVWDHDGERAARRAAELGAEATPDLEKIWQSAEIPGVVICSETDRHVELVGSAARAGKHMFVEKPLGMGAADSRRMADAIDQAGVIFQTGYFMRGSPVLRLIKEQLAAGAFGQVTRLRMVNAHSAALGGWFDTEWRWMADRSQAGVGAYGDLGTHILDIMIWLLGEVEQVAASTANFTGRYPGCDETGEGLLRFKSGALGSLAAGWLDVANPLTLELSGTLGHAAVFNGQLYFKSAAVEGADGKSPWTALPEPLPHAFELFLNALVGKSGQLLVTAQEAAYRSAVMEALYQAAAEHAWVQV
jgi:predicted dehydrogenase